MAARVQKNVLFQPRDTADMKTIMSLSNATTEILRFECPHCGGMCEVQQSEIKCGIFRHAVLTETFVPIDSHASQAKIARSKIHGCGKPFRIDSGGNISICGYD